MNTITFDMYMSKVIAFIMTVKDATCKSVVMVQIQKWTFSYLQKIK